MNPLYPLRGGKSALAADWIPKLLIHTELPTKLTLNAEVPDVATTARSSVMGAGFLPSSVGGTVGLGLALGVSLVALMIVRMAFDLLIWISPVPLIDLLFDTAKNLLSVAFLGVYFVSPVAATLVACLILAVTICLMPWAVRLLQFAYRVGLNPLLSKVVPGLRPELVESHLVPEGTSPASLACRAMALRARGQKKRQSVVLLSAGGPLQVMSRSLFRRHSSRPLAGADERVRLGRGLAWLEIRVSNADGRMLDRFAVSRALLDRYETLRVVLDAIDDGDLGAMRVLRGVQRATSATVNATFRGVQDRITRNPPRP